MINTGHKGEKLESLVKNLAADFLVRESGSLSLITVTRVILSTNKKYATIFFTAFPENQEKAALDFATRQLGEFRTYVGEHARIGRIPFFKFEIDYGEKNRQRIDEVARRSGEVG